MLMTIMQEQLGQQLSTPKQMCGVSPLAAPRVGNNKFKRAFHTLVGTSLRIINGADPVPFMPPSLRYHHVGGTVHVSKAGMMFKRPGVACQAAAKCGRPSPHTLQPRHLPGLTPSLSSTEHDVSLFSSSHQPHVDKPSSIPCNGLPLITY